MLTSQLFSEENNSVPVSIRAMIAMHFSILEYPFPVNCGTFPCLTAGKTVVLLKIVDTQATQGIVVEPNAQADFVTTIS